jgi:hypothetical protein
MRTEGVMASVAKVTAVPNTGLRIDLVPANPSRVGTIIQNTSTGTLSVFLDAASNGAQALSAIIAAGALWPVPHNFVGAISGLTSVADGTTYVTELY